MRRMQLWTQVILLISLTLCQDGLCNTFEEVFPDKPEGQAQDHDEEAHGGHHGVSLASWRWDEYSNIMICLLMIIFAGVLKIIFHHIPKLPRYLPESCVLIIVGIVVGCFVYFGLSSHSHHFPHFTSHLFFNVLLPPIILDSAYALYDRDFLANIGSVVFFAVVGTLFNVFAIGFLLYGVYKAGWMGDFAEPLELVKILVFSSLISAVDPVAVLAIFEEIGVNMGLYFLVFGESLLNDGVTVVLYNTMTVLASQETIESSQYLLAFFSFFTVVFGGLLIGVLIGALSAFILRFTKHTRVVEPLIIFATAYLSFILAETIHWSGIISLIGCGIVQKRYAFLNISKKSYTTVKYSVKTMASFSDCIIFLFLGVVLLSHDQEWHTGFVLWTVFFCTIVRFISVFSLSWIVNKRRITRISLKEQFILAYGGLRGAVGFSLVTILEEGPFKNIFLTTTLVMIFFTVFIQGSTIKVLVNKLKITKKTTGAKMVSTEINEKAIDYVMAGVESVTGKYSRHRMLDKVRRFEDKHVKSMLLRGDAEDRLTLRLEKISYDEHLARLYGPIAVVHDQAVNLVNTEVTFDDDVKSEATPELTEKDRKKLKLALANTPFDKFTKKRFHQDSPEHLQSLLEAEQAQKLQRYQQSFRMRASRRERRGTGTGAGTGSIRSDAEDRDGEASLLLPISLDASSITNSYREVKEEIRKALSMQGED